MALAAGRCSDATIAGGGAAADSQPNRVTDSYGTVAGGGNNQAGDGDYRGDH